MTESYDPDFNIAEELENRLEAKNKSSWVRKTGVYHPSALSGCSRALYYDRIGEQPVQNIGPKLRMLFGAGHACHDFIQGILSDDGKTEFESEIPVSVKEYDIFGHTDGIYRKKGWVIEIKSISDDGFNVGQAEDRAHPAASLLHEGVGDTQRSDTVRQPEQRALPCFQG